MRNDIILLFEDGEEIGYLGGFAFAREDAWMQEVRAIIGLDTAARGPAMVMDAGPGNGRLTRQLAAACRYPVAALMGFAGSWFINRIFPLPNPHISFFLPPGSWLLFSAFLGLIIFLIWFAFQRARRLKLQTAFTIGVLLPWCGLMWLTVALVPRMAYLFTWPFLFGLVSCLVIRLRSAGWASLLLLALTILSVLVLFVPPILQGYLGSAFTELWLLLVLGSLAVGIILQSHRLSLIGTSSDS